MDEKGLVGLAEIKLLGHRRGELLGLRLYAQDAMRYTYEKLEIKKVKGNTSEKSGNGGQREAVRALSLRTAKVTWGRWWKCSL